MARGTPASGGRVARSPFVSTRTYIGSAPDAVAGLEAKTREKLASIKDNDKYFQTLRDSVVRENDGVDNSTSVGALYRNDIRGKDVSDAVLKEIKDSMSAGRFSDLGKSADFSVKFKGPKKNEIYVDLPDNHPIIVSYKEEQAAYKKYDEAPEGADKQRLREQWLIKSRNFRDTGAIDGVNRLRGRLGDIANAFQTSSSGIYSDYFYRSFAPTITVRFPITVDGKKQYREVR